MLNLYLICIKTIIFCKLFLLIQSSSTNDTIQQYIYYGNEANDGQFPYQICLEYMRQFACGGVLIKNNVVLTAAHCIRNQYDNYNLKVRAGSIYKLKGGKVKNVCEIIMHPEYCMCSHINDIAILKLCRPFKLNRKINTIPMVTKEPKINSKAIISGWGQTEDGTLSEILKYTNVIIKSSKYCKEKAQMTESDICAEGTNGKSPCYGDSGGPLVVNRKLAGITSRGHAICGYEGLPNFYTNVANYKDFIEEHVNV